MSSGMKGRPDNQIPWLTPYLMVRDVEASMEFYHQVFGMKKKEQVNNENGEPFHGELLYQGQLLMIGKEGKPTADESKSPNTSAVTSPVSFYLYCENVDHFYEKAIEAGAKSLATPEDMFWGDRCCRLECPNGYTWMFGTHLG